MRADRTPRPRHRLRAVVAAAAVAAIGLALPGTARAEESAPRGPVAGETVVGRLMQAWPETGEHEHDPAGTPAHAPLSWVEADGAAVRVPTEDLAGVQPGATVAVTVGGARPDAAGADGYEPARDVLTADVVAPAPETPAPETPALTAAAGPTNEITVVMVVPAGGEPDGTTLDQVVAAVDGPVAGFWAEETGGALTVGVTAAHDWLRTTAGCADPAALWAEAGAAVGFVPGPGRHLVLYVSSRPAELPGCSYGLAEVGSGPASGGRLYVRAATPSVIAHELGHNFGLGHSSGHQCDAAVESGACRTAGYRDYYDVMGASWSQLGSLNALQAERLGVLPAQAQRSVAAEGPATTVDLAPLSSRAGIRALRLADPGGATYWLEYRVPAGRDGWLADGRNRFGLDSGVLLRRAGEMPDTALLLDATPSPSAGWDADLRVALPVGVPVPVSGGDLTVTVVAVGPEAAAVTVVPTAGADRPTTPVPDGAGTQPVLPGRDVRGPAPIPQAVPVPVPAPAPVPAPVPAPAPVGGPVAPAGPAAAPRPLAPAAAQAGPASAVAPIALAAVAPLAPAAPSGWGAALAGGLVTALTCWSGLRRQRRGSRA